MAIPKSCRSETPWWEWLGLLCVVLSCCLLPFLSESASLPAGYEWNGDKEFANITGPTSQKRISTTYLVASPNDLTALAFIIETSQTTAPVCYLQIVFFYPPQDGRAPAPSSGYTIIPWTQPCPRTPLPSGNCSFAFTKDGDIQVRNSVAGKTILLWSSRTAGLNATTLDMLDYYTSEGTDGNLVLYNSSRNIVWLNARDDNGFQCDLGGSGPAQTSQAAKKKAPVTLIWLVLCWGALVLWDAGSARSGRNLLLAFGFVLCCLLLPSPSQSQPIQAGFTANWTSDYAAMTGDLGNTSWRSVQYSQYVVVSPANRTNLALQFLITTHWGPTCFLEVVADRRSTDIIVASAPAPSTDVSLNTFQYVPWSSPCPRIRLPNGNCTFAFTRDGDIQVLNGVGGGYDIVWSSNTAGLGATTLDVLDSDPSGSGSIVLYNARNEVVWRNVRDMSNQDIQCGNPIPETSFAAALRISIASPSLLLMLVSSAFQLTSLFLAF